MENKFYYELIDKSEASVKLVGPIPGMFECFDGGEYKYVQVLQGKIVAAFKEHEILTLNEDLRTR